MEMFNDPLLYINWGACILGIYLIWRFGPALKRDIDRPVSFLIKFALLGVCIVGCLYISQRAGDLQIEKLIKATK